MSKRKVVGILIILGGIIILVVLVYLLFFSKIVIKEKINNINNKVNTFKKNNISKLENNKQEQEPKEIEAKKIIAHIEEKPQQNSEEDNLKFKAASFAERFGSFSNQSNFQNIIDLKFFMSDNMKRWANSYVTELRQKHLDRSEFYNIITKAITEEIKELDLEKGTAVVLVHTIRNENKGNQTSRFNQDIIIKFIKEKGAWKVDSAHWQ